MSISLLQQYGIVSNIVTVTGDNLLTAASVSRECGILPRDGPLALVTVIPHTTGPSIRLKPLSIVTPTSVSDNLINSLFVQHA